MMTRLLLIAGAILSAAVTSASTAVGASAAAVAPDPAPLQVVLLGIAVDAQPGYVRVSEVVDLHNPTGRTVLEDVAFPLPRGARYVTFHEGLQRPRVEASRIVDRLTMGPGILRIAYAYSVAGIGEVALDRQWSMPIERVEVFATAPAEIRSARLEVAPAVDADGRTYTRASARDLRPGTLALTVIGVPTPRYWPAPAAAGTLAGLLILGLVWTVVRNGRGTNR